MSAHLIANLFLALQLLTFASSAFAQALPKLSWEARVSDCIPTGLAVSPNGQSYTACTQDYGRTLTIYSYDLHGLQLAKHSVVASSRERLFANTILLSGNKLFLDIGVIEQNRSYSRLLAVDAQTLTVLWQKDQKEFIGRSLIAHPDGNFWQLGLSNRSPINVIGVRYTSQGEQLAQVVYETGYDNALGFEKQAGAPAPEGGIYVGASAQIFRVSGQGEIIWKRAYEVSALVSSADGSLITITSLRAPNGSTHRLNADGELVWSLDLGGSSIAISSNGNTWIFGTQVMSEVSSWDLRIGLIAPQGKLLMTDDYKGPYQDQAVDLAIDNNNNAYILASSYVPSDWSGLESRYLLVKYSSAGERLWDWLYERSGTPEALSVRTEDEIFAAGTEGIVHIELM